ncbi:MAG: DotH/IcmK family type IV secretion protein [Acidiferrobacteraceae bacterium]
MRNVLRRASAIIGVVLAGTASAHGATATVGTVKGMPANGVGSAMFREIMLGNYPLTPTQIHALKHRARASQKAAAMPVAPVIMRSRVAEIIPQPGLLPLRMGVARGYVSALVFVDSQGHPWPVVSIHNADATQIQAIPSKALSNSVLLTPVAANPFVRGGIMVDLQGLDEPVPVMVRSGGPADAILTVRVQGESPTAKLPTPGGSTEQTLFGRHVRGQRSGLLHVLGGLPPNAKAIPVAFPDAGRSLQSAQGWVLHQRLWLRLPRNTTLFSPAWQRRASAQGWTAYEIPVISEVLVSRDGAIQSVSIHQTSSGGR